VVRSCLECPKGIVVRSCPNNRRLQCFALGMELRSTIAYGELRTGSVRQSLMLFEQLRTSTMTMRSMVPYGHFGHLLSRQREKSDFLERFHTRCLGDNYVLQMSNSTITNPSDKVVIVHWALFQLTLRINPYAFRLYGMRSFSQWYGETCGCTRWTPMCCSMLTLCRPVVLYWDPMKKFPASSIGNLFH
jgi:hypothetical protein